MKYRVVGANRDTGARMTLELEADSRARAEQKATLSGMNVQHLQEITDGEIEHAMEPRPRHHGPSDDRGGLPGFVKVGLFLLIVAGVVYFFWDRIRGAIGQ